MVLAGLVGLAGCAGSAHGGVPGAAVEPASATTRDVQFASGRLVLAGTLHVPEGVGQRPAVVLLHGSGPQSRDAEMTGQLAMKFGCTVDLFEDLAEGLQNSGFVVLRYDKRTCGPFNDCGDNEYPFPGLMHVVTDLLADAASAVLWLGKQPEVDPKRVYVVGHSEGGVLVPRLLTDLAQVRGGVMLATPHSAIDRVLEEQALFLDQKLAAQGKSVEERGRILSELNDQLRSVRAVRAGTFKGGMIDGATPMYWSSLMKLGDEVPSLAAGTPKPLLALSGDYDWNVRPEETAAWAKTFGVTGNPDHQTKVLPCITHAMTCIEERDWAKIGPRDIDCDIDPRVTQEVVDFLRRYP